MRHTITLTVTRARLLLAAVVVSVLVAGCGGASAFGGQPDWFTEQEKMSDKIAEASAAAVPYPLAAVEAGGFLELKNLAERLTRFSKQSKVGYLYLVSFGKFVGYYAVRGKISSVNSQMTNSNQTWSCGHECETVVDSIGDDGSFGPNEGGDRGVFFFTSNGTMVETTLDWVYSDQPLSIDVPNLLK